RSVVRGPWSVVSSQTVMPPHPQAPLPWGEGGRRTGEGSVADRDALLGGMRSLAYLVAVRHSTLYRELSINVQDSHHRRRSRYFESIRIEFEGRRISGGEGHGGSDWS